MRRTCAVVVVTVVSALALAATSDAVPDFETPGKTIYCGIVEAYEVPPGYVAPLTCWRSGNGFTVFLRALHGARTEWKRGNKGAYLTAGHVLRFGQQWWSTRRYSGMAPRRAGFSTGASTEPLVSPVRTASVMDFGSVGIGEFGSFDRPSPNDDRPRFDPIQPSDGPPRA